jgi:tRNA-splicing ligase RtcB
MGDRSYIVNGTGNAASFCSCSHGAGRRMSRTAARKTLDRDGLVAAMAGKAWNNDAENLIDEDPRAYKSIDEVMANQADLVNIEHELRQVLNYKGL